MGSRGIRDRVCIVGMGCIPFGEHWDLSTDDMLLDAATATLASTGVTRDDIDAYWLGTAASGISGLTLSRALRIGDKPVTRLENMCATGSEALRNASYAVASGAYDMAMAIGVEKLKDSGFSGLTRMSIPNDGTAWIFGDTTPPANFSLLAPAYAKKDGVKAAGSMDPDYDFTTFPEVVTSAADAYAQAGITDPRAEIAMAEVHDCFTPTELVLMEDLGFAERGFGWKEVLAGTFDLDGDLPVNPDGGLKSFGHPIGASGLRMLLEAWLQLRREAGERQLHNGKKLALTHNLGGAPGACVSFVSATGTELSE